MDRPCFVSDHHQLPYVRPLSLSLSLSVQRRLIPFFLCVSFMSLTQLSLAWIASISARTVSFLPPFLCVRPPPPPLPPPCLAFADHTSYRALASLTFFPAPWTSPSPVPPGRSAHAYSFPLCQAPAIP
ncbi:hypothetical protein Vretifemale_20306 [Volvox reticuliferus]|uniref:Uncharacterized protein n=1 Tax=Volvox reticuliferus TaxID=1737510 RepID=A0A8J4D568_9CHLO|nr:hypothetical protein Vretifemale_20306 [Volvox reticuliferus]